jgi:hypothetical protein
VAVGAAVVAVETVGPRLAGLTAVVFLWPHPVTVANANANSSTA